MADGGDPPRHGVGRGRGEGGEPSTTPTVGLPLQLKQPNFNWEGNVYENYKTFSERATILLGGPYAKYDDPSKISAFLSWTGDKGFQLYKNINWERTGYNKDRWEDVVKAFGEEFKPCQTVMQSWYQLGNLYSSHCKDQTEFMTRIKELAKEGGGSPIRKRSLNSCFSSITIILRLGNTLLTKLSPPKPPMIS